MYSPQTNWAINSTLVDLAMLPSATREAEEKKGHHAIEHELKQRFLELEYVHPHEVPTREESVVCNVRFEISGINAAVSYDRSILKAGSKEVKSRLREVRVWHHQKYGWTNVHFVRRPI